jgi:hypothetical protein
LRANDESKTGNLPRAGGTGNGKRKTANGKSWLLAFAAFVCLSAALTGCRQDMQLQPRVDPLRRSDFYADLRSARPLPLGTIPRESNVTDPYFYTGYVGKDLGNYMPFPVTREVLERGRERFDIFCAPCHSRLGDGNGMVVQRGYRRPPSYHIDRLRNAPLGHFYDVISNGFGAMPDYAAQVPPYDRWAIVAYVRALQLSQNAPASVVPVGTQLPSAPPPTSGTPGSGATVLQTVPSSGNSPAPQTPAGQQQLKRTQPQKNGNKQ